MIERLNGIGGSLVFASLLGAVATNVEADVLYKFCDIRETIEASTPDEARYQRNRGAALLGAILTWNRRAADFAGEEYGDFAVATNKVSNCDTADTGFICKLAGDPCRRVSGCVDPDDQNCLPDH